MQPLQRWYPASLPFHSTLSQNSRRSTVSIARKGLFFFCSSHSMHEQSEEIMENSITITSLEKKIFDTLKAVLLHFQFNTQLRVAGGWVRDKILGKECHDIDIALEDMLGKVFCDKVNEYFTSINEATCNVCIIQRNPDQSKHLETAKMKIFGVEIDFVNLRAEAYTENSRIPVMKFGTPEEDALRRDLTINSLFYNINTNSIEDFTGKGLHDLRKGIIATPLPPKMSFLDDPLRVLRAIRFAARFNYKIQEELKQAVADTDVKVALSNKVSLERIGAEIDLMIRGANPTRAIQELVDMNIFWVVFRLPQELKTAVPDELKRACLSSLDAMLRVLAVFGSSKLTEDQRRIGLYAALLLPLTPFSYKDRKDKEIRLASSIIKDSLKLKVNDATMVISLHRAAQDLQTVFKVVLEEEQGDLEDARAEEWELSTQSRKRICAGFWIYEIKEMWRVALLLGCIIEPSFNNELQDQEVNKRADRCLAAEASLVGLGLENIWKGKPLLDGKQIMAELGLDRGGPEIKEWQTRIRKWQLCHLTGTSEECLDWFRGQCTSKRRRCS